MDISIIEMLKIDPDNDLFEMLYNSKNGIERQI